MNTRIDAVPYDKTQGELRIGDGAMRFTERVPHKNDRSIGKTVLAFHGILAGETSLSPFARSLAETGVVTVTAASRFSVKHAALELAALTYQLEAKYEQPVVLSAHSLGALYGLEAASMSPEDTELLLLQGAGFGGVHLKNMISSLATGRPDNSHLHHERKLVRDGIRFGWHNRRDIRELIRRATSLEGVALAGALPDGIVKNAIEFPGDTLISGEESRANLESAGFSVHALRVVRAGHNAQAYHWQDVADLTNLIIHDAVPSGAKQKTLELAS